MNLEQLRLFITVAETLNFTKAAKIAFIAQPALSRIIAELERELGVKLFDRNNRFVRLTAAGKVLLEESREIIIRIDKAVERTRRADFGMNGSLKVGFLSSLVKRFFSECISVFRQRYSDIDLCLAQYNMGPLHKALENGDVDIGFTMLFDIQDSQGIAHKKIYKSGISLVLHKGHPLYDQSEIDLSMVAQDPFIMLAQQESPIWYRNVMMLCRKSGFVPNIVASPPLVGTVLMLVDAGIGITIATSCSKNYEIPNLRFVELVEEETQLDVVVAWKKANSNPAVAFFLKEMENYMNF